MLGTTRWAAALATAATIGWTGGSAAALQGAPGADSAAAPTAFGERVEVELVNVDVWVSDERGEPATGLTAADFEILHDGGPVEVSHFSEVRGGRATGNQVTGARATRGQATEGQVAEGPVAEGPASGSEDDGGEDAHLILYFDQSRLHPSNYRRLLDGARELLDGGGIEPERVLVLRQESGLGIVAPFGSSRRELDAALARLSDATARGLDLEKEEELALRAVRDSWERSQDAVGSGATGISSIPPAAGQPGGGGGNSPRGVVGGAGSSGGIQAGPDACGSFLGQVQPILDSWTRSRGQRIAVTLENLNHTASFLAGLPGVKTLLYLSDGLDTQPGAALAAYATSLCPAGAADLLTGTLSEEMTSRFVELTRHANSNRVTIHSIQAGGLSGSSAGAASAGGRPRGGGSSRAEGAFESSRRGAERAGLSLIAGETGGRAVFNQNELGPELARIGRDIGTYYSLAYEPPSGGDLRDHRIEVRLRDGSLTPRYRRGYLEKDRARWLAERIEGALNLGITDNPLAVRLGVGATSTAADGSIRLPLHVMVPVESLAFLPAAGSSMAEITVQVMARHVETNLLATRGDTFRIAGEPGASGFASLTIELDLAAGVYVTAVGVQDVASREASFVSTALEVAP